MVDNQQEIIVQTADRLFKKFGIRSVSINDVCKELHMSKKTFYVYFNQKEDLVDAVLNYQERSNIEFFDRAFKNKNAIDSLILIIKEIKKGLDCESKTMYYDLEKYYPKVFEEHRNRKNQYNRIGFEKNIHQGIEEGYYRDDLDVEIISLFHSYQIKNTLELMKQTAPKYSNKRILDFFIDLLIHMVANEKGLKYLSEHYSKTE